MDRRPATETGTSMAGLVPRKRVRVSDRAPVFRSTCSAGLSQHSCIPAAQPHITVWAIYILHCRDLGCSLPWCQGAAEVLYAADICPGLVANTLIEGGKLHQWTWHFYAQRHAVGDWNISSFATPCTTRSATPAST